MHDCNSPLIIRSNILCVIAEEVILAEERTTEEEKMHIIEGLYYFTRQIVVFVFIILYANIIYQTLKHRQFSIRRTLFH